MSSAVLTQGIGAYGGAACVPTLGFACASRTTDCFQACTVGSPKNNRITVATGGGFKHRDSGENKFMSADAVAAELGEKFNDPRYYGREL